VRIVTWNLWWRFGPWEARYDAIVATLQGLDADIICLQETWIDGDETQAQRLGDDLGLHAAVGDGPRWDGVGFSNAVLARRPIESFTTLVLPDEHGASTHRRATIAELGRVASDAANVTVVSTHLEHRLSRSGTRVAQVGELQRQLHSEHHDERVVLMGADLNALPDSDELRILTGRSAPAAPLIMSDAWEMAGDGSPGWTWRAEHPYLAES
jgi:endonuclease/exonuclease/phosphatase family metal-dependent hydrolase